VIYMHVGLLDRFVQFMAETKRRWEELAKTL